MEYSWTERDLMLPQLRMVRLWASTCLLPQHTPSTAQSPDWRLPAAAMAVSGTEQTHAIAYHNRNGLRQQPFLDDPGDLLIHTAQEKNADLAPYCETRYVWRHAVSDRRVSLGCCFDQPTISLQSLAHIVRFKLSKWISFESWLRMTGIYCGQIIVMPCKAGGADGKGDQVIHASLSAIQAWRHSSPALLTPSA